METWLNYATPDSELHLLSFQLYRADCDANYSQAQEQFLPPCNPPYEQLNVPHIMQ